MGSCLTQSSLLFPPVLQEQRLSDAAGGTIYPILFYRLLTHSSVGFAWAARILGFFAFGTCMVSVLVLRAPVKPAKQRVLFDLRAFREPPFTLLTIALFLGLVGIYVPTFYIQLFALRSRTPPIASADLSAYMLPILNAAAIPGRICPGFITNTTGVLNFWSLLLACLGILTLCWIAVQNLGGLIAFALIYGFCFGGVLSLPPAAIVSLSSDLSMVGTRIGTSCAFASLGVLIGTPIGGVILGKEAEPDFLGLQIFGGVVLITSAAFGMSARITKVRWSIKRKA